MQLIVFAYWVKNKNKIRKKERKEKRKKKRKETTQMDRNRLPLSLYHCVL